MTSETKFKLLATFRQLGQQIDMSNFNARLVFQKQVYLLQELGLQLNKTYGWYIHGPYSRKVANDGFQLVPIQDDIEIEELPELTEVDLGYITEFQELLRDAQEEFPGKNEAYILELLASLHFTLKHGYPPPNNREDALAKFLELKPKFELDAQRALDLLERHNLDN